MAEKGESTSEPLELVATDEHAGQRLDVFLVARPEKEINEHPFVWLIATSGTPFMQIPPP